MKLEMTDNKSNRIQIVRGLAILAVVFIHNSPPGISQAYIRPFINFPVGTFLFLSGMLSSADHWNPAKRIKKLIIPYVIWTLVYVIKSHYKNPATIPVAYVINLITTGSTVMYYVFVYCELTLLIPLVDRLAKSKYKYLGFMISPVEIVVMRMLPLMLGYKNNKYVSILMGISCLGWLSYYYLGYLIGNKYIKADYKTSSLIAIWIISILLQIAEGIWWFSMEEANCGTQLKLTAILSGCLFVLIANRFINNDKVINIKVFKILGDNSFGIFFAHLAVMSVLEKFPYYKEINIFPINAVVAILVTLGCVLIGKKILGKNSKYLAL